jgi:hypothetical protein
MTNSTGDFISSLLPAPLKLVFTAVFAISIIYYVGSIVYRLYFHPLANIPGPLFAKITYLYFFYYNCLCGGRFYMKIDELHKIHGKREIAE